MKIYTLVVSLALGLTGCAVVDRTTFDPVEYSTWVQTAFVAQKAKAACGTADERNAALALQQTAKYAVLYGTGKNLNAQIAEAGKIVEELTTELVTRYQTGVPSVAYCQLKTTEIDVAARRVAFSLSKKEM